MYSYMHVRVMLCCDKGLFIIDAILNYFNGQLISFFLVGGGGGGGSLSGYFLTFLKLSCLGYKNSTMMLTLFDE